METPDSGASDLVVGMTLHEGAEAVVYLQMSMIVQVVRWICFLLSPCVGDTRGGAKLNKG